MAIGTHVFPCLALTALKKKKDIKFINVATDYECIPFWNETNPDLFVIPSEKLISKFVEKGIKKDILLPIGIPVASSFLILIKILICHMIKKSIVNIWKYGFWRNERVCRCNT